MDVTIVKNLDGSNAAFSVVVRGGSRRSRGARLSNWARKHPEARLHARVYSETYGFQTATYASYVLV